MHKYLAAFLLILVLVISGCSIEKRLYRKGWYISSRKEWKSDGVTEQANFKSEQSKTEKLEPVDCYTIIDANRIETLVLPDSVDSAVKNEVSVLPVPEGSFNTAIMSKVSSIGTNFFRKKQTDDPTKEKSTDSTGVSVVIIIMFVFTLSMVLISFSLGMLPQSLLVFIWFLGMIILTFIGVAVNERRKNRNKEPVDADKQLVTGEELNQLKQKRKRKALFFTFYVLIALAILVLTSIETIYFVQILLAASLFSLFVLVTHWAEYLRIRKATSVYIKKRPITSDQEAESVEKPSEEVIRKRQKARIKRAVFLQVFILITFYIIFLLVFSAAAPTINGLLVFSAYLFFFSFLIWQPTIYKNNHPELEKAEEVQPDVSRETEFVEEIDPLIKMAARIKRLKRQIVFSAFGSVALLLVALMALNAFMWVFFGLFVLITLVTLFDYSRLKKKMQTEAS